MRVYGKLTRNNLTISNKDSLQCRVRFRTVFCNIVFETLTFASLLGFIQGPTWVQFMKNIAEKSHDTAALEIMPYYVVKSNYVFN